MCAYARVFVQLEVEVSTLKERLDGLRKAKNTIVHREREASSPNMVRLQGVNRSPHPPQQRCHSDSNLLQLNSQVCIYVCVYV